MRDYAHIYFEGYLLHGHQESRNHPLSILHFVHLVFKNFKKASVNFPSNEFLNAHFSAFQSSHWHDLGMF